MAFCSYSKDFTLTKSTSIENIFIFEYMPDSSGDAAKVYLYGLYLCQAMPEKFSIEDFCATLKLKKEDVAACFVYWEECGLLEIISEEPFEVRYLPISGTGSKPRRFKAEKYTAFTNSIQQIIPKRMISTNEYTEYFNLMETFNIRPEAMIMIVKYCADLKGDDISYRYITAVAKDFAIRGIVTAEGVEKELSDYFARSSEIAELLKALGSKKKPEIDDLNHYNKWNLELGFEKELILFAAGKVKKGGIKQLDALIGEFYSNKIFTKTEAAAYLKEKENLKELALRINKALSVYYEVLEPVITSYTGPWLAKGYDEKTLLLIANYCFKHNKRSLEEMDEAVDRLYKQGLISIESIMGYIEKSKADDSFLKELLGRAGIVRKPNEWDKQNYRLWKDKWNLSDELILYAAEVSNGKNSPIPYINAILGNWKNLEIFTVEEAKKHSPVSKKPSEKTFKNQRTYSEEELKNLLNDGDEIDIIG